MNVTLLANDIILDDARFLRLAFDGYVAPGTPVSDRAHFDVSKALDILRADPALGARLLGSAPGNGGIFWTGDMSSERLDGQSVGVRVVSRRTGDEVVGDNRFGRFLERVRDAYRERLRTEVVPEEPVREGQVICDFTPRGAFLSEIEEREQAGERFIHVDVYRPAKFRFDAALDGTTGHASRRSDADVSFHKFVCPFGTSYPAPVIVGSAAEASFLYEKALRGELDWKATLDDLSARGLLSRSIGEKQKAALVQEYSAQFAWMREQICRDASLRGLPIVSSGLLVPDASLGRSVYDAELAPSPAHVLARYINNPVLLFAPAENGVFRALAQEVRSDPATLKVPAGYKGSVDVLVVGSDVIGGREPGTRATTEVTRRRVKDEQGREVVVASRGMRIKLKDDAAREKDYADFAARMDAVLAGIPEDVRVRFVTGNASGMSDSVGVGVPLLLRRYVEEHGGSVYNWNYSRAAAVPSGRGGDAGARLGVVMMEHFSQGFPVLCGAEEEVSFLLDENDPGSEVTLRRSAAPSGAGAVCFSHTLDTNNRNVLALGSLAASGGVPVVHVIDNSSEEAQARQLEGGAGLSRAELGGELSVGVGELFSGERREGWDLGAANVLSYVDRDSGLASPFVVNEYRGGAVVGGHPLHSALGAFVALALQESGNADLASMMKVVKADGSLSGLLSVYDECVQKRGGLDEVSLERALRRSVRLMASADTMFAQRLLELDGRDIVMPVREDPWSTGLFTDLDGRGLNRFGMVLASERARMLQERQARRDAAEKERERMVEEAARRQKLAVGGRADGQKVAGGFPARLPGRPDAVWFLGTNTPDQFVIRGGDHSFEMWDDMDGEDPLVREKAAREWVDDGDGGRIPNRFVFLFPSDLASVTGSRSVANRSDSRNLTGVTRKDADGSPFVCAYGVPVRMNAMGYEMANDQNMPCSYRLDNDAANFAESLVLADSCARAAALRHDMALCLPGRTRRDGSEYFTLGQVFMDKIYDRREKGMVPNPHRSPLNLDLTDRYVNLLRRGREYPLNCVVLPQETYRADGSAEEVRYERERAAAESRPYISAEGRFISDFMLSLRIANAAAVALGVPLRFPLDEKGRIDLGPGVPEEFRALAERKIDSFIGVVRQEDVLRGALPVLERISMFEAAKYSDSFRKAEDLMLRPNELVYAFGGYDFDNILASRNAPLHEMAFRSEDGTVFEVIDAKMTRGMDPDDVNRYLRYEKNDVRRFVVRTTDPSKAPQFIAALKAYCERAKAVQVETRLLGEKEAEAAGKGLEGYVKLFSSNSERFATNEHEIGRSQSIYNSTNRFDGVDAEEVYWGKVDARDGFEGYAQIRYLLPDGRQSSWRTVTDLELAKDLVMSMVHRKYRDERVVPSDAVMRMLVTAQAVAFAGDDFRTMEFEGRKVEVDDKVVRLEPEKPSGVAVAGPAEVTEEVAVPAFEVPVQDAPVFPVSFTESAGGYSKRTWENANAQDVDFTFQFALDFGTAGELCTQRAAGDSCIRVSLPLRDGNGLDCSPAAVKAAVEAVASMLPDEYLAGEPFGVNVAGNGLYTLAAAGVSQKQCDEFVTRTLAGLCRRGAVLSSVRTGGQTGIDEAGAVAGCVLQVPTTVHAPKGWQQRGADGRDVSGERAFKARFAGKDYASLRAMVAASRRKEQTVKNVISK